MPKRVVNYQPLTSRSITDKRRFFREDDSGLYSYMFVEDVRTHIIPYGGRSYSGNPFQVNISNPSLETETKALFHISHGYDPFHQTLSRAICHFIHEAASFLLVKGGKAYFEIVDATIDDNQALKSIHILQPIFGRVVRFGKTYFQIVPSEGKLRYISVPKSRVWVLEIPKALGTTGDVISLSKSMKELGKASLLGSDIVGSQKDFFGFEFTNFHSSIETAVLGVTREWGWDMRMGLNNRYALEYYRYYRLLQFGYSMAIFRNDLLSKMNVLLSRLSYDAILSFSGLPNPDEILDAIKKMEQRQLSFQEAFDLISF